MFTEISEWLWDVVSTAGVAGVVIAGAGYLLRDTIAKFFTKAIENRFDEKLETFRANIRDNEKELGEIRSFLMSAQRERDSAIQMRRLEAAENLLRARDALSQLSMAVEYLKILNTDKILEDDGDPRIADFIDTLIKPLEIEDKLKEINSVDKAKARLYLSEKSLKYFDLYQKIILHASMMIKLLSIDLKKRKDFIKEGSLSKDIIDVIPSSKDGFEKWGDAFAYYWSTHFHDEILKSLRHEVSGADDLSRDTESIARLALESRNAQINVRSTLAKAGLPETLINPDEIAPESAPVAG